MSEAVNHPPLDPASHMAELDRISQAANANLDAHRQRINDELDAALRDIHATTAPNIQEPETTPIHSEREEANMANAFGRLNAEVAAPIDYSKPLDRTTADAAARNARSEFLAENRAMSLGSRLAPEAGIDENGQQYGPDLFVAAAEEIGEEARDRQLDLQDSLRYEENDRARDLAEAKAARDAEHEAEVQEALAKVQEQREQTRVAAFRRALDEGPEGRRDARIMLDVMLDEAQASGDWSTFGQAYDSLTPDDQRAYSETPRAQAVMDARAAEEEREAQEAAVQAAGPAVEPEAIGAPASVHEGEESSAPLRSRLGGLSRTDRDALRNTPDYTSARARFDVMTSDAIEEMDQGELRQLTAAERIARQDALHEKYDAELPPDALPAPANRFAGMSREELDGIDPITMTTEDRDAYFAAYRATREGEETQRPVPLGQEAVREPESRGRRFLKRVGAVAAVALAATLGTTLAASITGEHPNKPGNAAPSVSAAKSASPLELVLPSSSPAPSASASKAPGQQGGGAQQGVGNGQPGGNPGEQNPGTPAGPKVHELAPKDTVWDFVKREMGLGDVPDYLLTDEQASKLRKVTNGILKDNGIPDQGRFMRDYQPFSYRPFDEYIKTVS